MRYKTLYTAMNIFLQLKPAKLTHLHLRQRRIQPVRFRKNSITVLMSFRDREEIFARCKLVYVLCIVRNSL